MANNMSVQVLIVDDNPGVLFLHELMIMESNFSDNIMTFRKAQPALAYLQNRNKKSTNCVVFLDINMPQMNGWDFLKSLEKSDYGKGVYVVMVTSSINSSDRRMAASFKNIIDYIEKPLNVDICKKLQKNKRLNTVLT